MQDRPIPARRLHLSQPCSVAALAFHDLVALLEQALAFAILARGFLFDFGAFFIGHDGLRCDGSSARGRPMDARLASKASTNNGVARLLTRAARRVASDED